MADMMHNQLLGYNRTVDITDWLIVYDDRRTVRRMT